MKTTNIQRGAWPGWLMWLAPVMVVLVYLRTRGFEMVWDDTGLSTLPVYSQYRVLEALTTAANGFEYLPMRDLSLMLDYRLFGDWAGGFHMTNMVLFMLAAVLVYRFYLKVFCMAPAGAVSEHAGWYALACSLIFVVHPLQVEPVSFITSRNALLALVFSLAALLSWLVYLERGGRLVYTATLALLVLALLSKATAIFLPLLFILLLLYRDREVRLLDAFFACIPFLVITALVVALHLYVGAHAGTVHGPAVLGSGLIKLQNLLFIPAFYVFKFLLPVNLTVAYPVGEYLQAWWMLLPAALLYMLAARVLLLRFRQRSLDWFLLWGYLIALLPVSNLLPTSPMVADRYAQIPLVWLTPLLVVPLLVMLQQRLRLVVVLAVVAVLTVLSVRQTAIWKNNLALYEYAVRLDPGHLGMINNLANELWEAGREQEALQWYRRAAEIQPLDAGYDLHMAVLAQQRGDLQEARRILEAATHKEGLAIYQVHLKLAEIYIKLRMYGKARDALRKGIELAGKTRSERENTAKAQRLINELDDYLARKIKRRKQAVPN